jgi:hypothetical protein
VGAQPIAFLRRDGPVPIRSDVPRR